MHVEIPTPSKLRSCPRLNELFDPKIVELHVRKSSMRSPLRAPRTRSLRASDWVRVRAPGETRGKNRER